MGLAEVVECSAAAAADNAAAVAAGCIAGNNIAAVEAAAELGVGVASGERVFLVDNAYTDYMGPAEEEMAYSSADTGIH